jgi:hypothetical protein
VTHLGCKKIFNIFSTGEWSATISHPGLDFLLRTTKEALEEEIAEKVETRRNK